MSSVPISINAAWLLTRTLFHEDWLKAVLFGFAQGERLSEHTASMLAVLHFLQGNVRLTLDDDTLEAWPDTWVEASQAQPFDALTFAEAARQYIPLLRQHIVKENNVLFRMAERVMSEADEDAVTGHFSQVEQERGLTAWHQSFSNEVAGGNRRLDEVGGMADALVAANATEPRREGPMAALRYALFVSDVERSVAFYRDVLGWPVTCQSPDRTELATERMTLALQYASKASGAAAVQGEIAGRCQLGLWVDDVEAFHQDMVARGTLCIQPPTEDAFGAKLAVYADPDGLPFSVAESLTKEPADQGLLGSEP